MLAESAALESNVDPKPEVNQKSYSGPRKEVNPGTYRPRAHLIRKEPSFLRRPLPQRSEQVTHNCLIVGLNPTGPTTPCQSFLQHDIFTDSRSGTFHRVRSIELNQLAGSAYKIFGAQFGTRDVGP